MSNAICKIYQGDCGNVEDAPNDKYSVYTKVTFDCTNNLVPKSSIVSLNEPYNVNPLSKPYTFFFDHSDPSLCPITSCEIRLLGCSIVASSLSSILTKNADHSLTVNINIPDGYSEAICY